MIPEEFKTQIFKTKAQWESGLLHRLEMTTTGGISLYPMPAFTGWSREIKGIINPCCIAADQGGQVYFIDKDNRQLYSYNFKTSCPATIPGIGGRGTQPGKFKKPTRMIIGELTLWVLDAGNNRVQAFSKQNFQLKYLIENLKGPVDIAANQQNLYILDKINNRDFKILTYDHDGNPTPISFDETRLQDPAGMAAGPGNKLYIIDRGTTRIHTYTTQGQYTGVTGDLKKISPDFKLTIITIDKKGNIYVVDSQTGTIHRFDPDGSYIGIISIPGLTGAILDLAADPIGNLYAAAAPGIACFDTRQTLTKEKGIYYTKTLDSGTPGNQWHRLHIEANLPANSSLEIYYYSTDNEEMKQEIENLHTHPELSVQEKARRLEKTITWTGPEKNPQDMLFKEKTGRYLWLKLVLSAGHENAPPAITRMKVYYPRDTYLRYLPAIYQEDKTGREFLERFLSIFETVFSEIETGISTVYKYIDSETAPQDFLHWLGTWLNLAMEEDWPEKMKRRFLSHAPELYQKKGTAAGIKKLIEIYTGKPPAILEGLTCIPIPLQETPPGKTPPPAKSSRETAHHFIVIMTLSPREYEALEPGVTRLLDEEKPAHTEYKLCNISEMRLGMNTLAGIGTRLTDHGPGRLGIDTVIGTGMISGRDFQPWNKRK